MDRLEVVTEDLRLLGWLRLSPAAWRTGRVEFRVVPPFEVDAPVWAWLAGLEPEMRILTLMVRRRAADLEPVLVCAAGDEGHVADLVDFEPADLVMLSDVELTRLTDGWYGARRPGGVPPAAPRVRAEIERRAQQRRAHLRRA